MAIKPKVKKGIVNFFGALGYFFCMLQWLFTVAIYANFLKTLLAVEPNVEKHVTPVAGVIDLTSNTPLMIIISIFTIVVIVFALYVFIKIPSTVVKVGKKVVHETAEHVAPVILRIRHIDEAEQTPKKLKMVASRVMIVIKILLIILPIVLAYYSQFTDNRALDFSIVMFGSVGLACVSLTSFLLQYVLARLVRIPQKYLW